MAGLGSQVEGDGVHHDGRIVRPLDLRKEAINDLVPLLWKRSAAKVTAEEPPTPMRQPGTCTTGRTAQHMRPVTAPVQDRCDRLTFFSSIMPLAKDSSPYEGSCALVVTPFRSKRSRLPGIEPCRAAAQQATAMRQATVRLADQASLAHVTPGCWTQGTDKPQRHWILARCMQQYRGQGMLSACSCRRLFIATPQERIPCTQFHCMSHFCGWPRVKAMHVF